LAQTPEQAATVRNNLAQLLQAANRSDEAEQAAAIEMLKASVEQRGSP